MSIPIPAIVGRPVRLAVLVSGGGTTLANLRQHIAAGRLEAQIACVICSNPPSYEKVTDRQGDLTDEIHLVHRKQFESVEAFSEVVWRHIRQAEVDLVCLAGFLSLLDVPEAYRWRVLNIHPALLPAFGGKGMFGHHVHEAVIAHGCKISGCTVHFADQTYDTGPILVQRACPVHHDDTPDSLAARVFEQECEAYPEAVRLVASGRVTVDGRAVRIAPDPQADLPTQARQFAELAHAGQKRGEGDYVYHPLSVALVLRTHGVTDPHTLAAAYLHDVVEDTRHTIDDLRQRFGSEIAQTVAELTLSEEERSSVLRKHAALAEHARQMSDRARLIKLADRLQNLSELHLKPPARRVVYAEATLDLLEALRPYPDPGGSQMASQIRHLVAWHLQSSAEAHKSGPEAPRT